MNNFLMTLLPLTKVNPFEGVSKPIIDLLNMVMGPLIAVVGAVGAIYCVILGVKLAKAEEQQDREKAKTALKNAIIGFVLIFVLVVALKVSLPLFEQWMASAASGN